MAKNAKRSFLIALLLIMIGGGYWWWQNTQRESPEYALRQTSKAVQQHDVDLFHKYVDVERASERLISDLASYFNAQPGDEETKELVSRVVSEVDRYIETGDAIDAPFGGFFSTADSLRTRLAGVEDIRVEGKLAIAKLRILYPEADTSLSLDLRLRHRDEHWKVIEFGRISEFLTGVEELQDRRRIARADSLLKEALREAGTAMEKYGEAKGRYPTRINETPFMSPEQVRVLGGRTDTGYVLGATYSGENRTFCLSSKDAQPERVAGGLRACVPSQLLLRMPDWMSVDDQNKMVTIQLVAGQTDANTHWNFNGYHDGNATVVVPEGYEITLKLENQDQAVAHSVGVDEQAGGYPATFDRVTPPFRGAVTSGATKLAYATQPGESETITFNVSEAGNYALVCYVPAHATQGMWIRFVVSDKGAVGVELD